jgi:hypothetical protein
MMKKTLLITAILFLFATVSWAADATYSAGVYHKAGGDEEVVASGGKITVESGGIVDIESGASLKLAGTAITATAAELNAAADISANVEVVTATNVILAAESGKTFFLDAAAGFQSTLPAPAAGLRFTFIVKTAPTSNGYTIVTNGTTQKVLKGLAVIAADAVGDVSAGGTTATFVHNQALPGDRVDTICDGTIWYMVGYAQVTAGLTITGE